jgi:hypothetical protein
MARLPAIKRIRQEDFDPKYSDLLPGLLYAINTFFESVVAALNKGLTFRDNFLGQVQDIVTIGPLNNNNAITFKREFNFPCTGIVVLAANPADNPNALLSTAPFVQFVNTDTGVRITNITGIPGGERYRLRLLCVYE